jgi:hypothetical protein
MFLGARTCYVLTGRITYEPDLQEIVCYWDDIKEVKKNAITRFWGHSVNQTVRFLVSWV